jgi:hypothetical protein
MAISVQDRHPISFRDPELPQSGDQATDPISDVPVGEGYGPAQDGRFIGP